MRNEFSSKYVSSILGDKLLSTLYYSVLAQPDFSDFIKDEFDDFRFKLAKLII